MKIGVLVVLIGMCGGACLGAESFKDVPKDHWAAGAVQKLKDEGVVQGYPDGTFKGNQPVTRYELAAALVRFVEFLQESEKPVVTDKQKPAAQSSSGGFGSAAALCCRSNEPEAVLVDGGFLPKDSALAKDGKKPVTSEELADALASVAKRLIELRVKEEPVGSQ